LVRLLDAGGAAAAALSSDDAVLLGGAATPAPLLDRARAAGVRVLTTYGMSETAGGCVYDGRPLPGASVEVEADGRITLGGPTLAGGYRLQPDLTATAFAGGRFRTRDLGRFDDDGRLVVLGRADDVIVTGGEKVAPGPVEAALAEHPLVREVAVVGVADAQWGQRVVAVVVPGVGVPTLEALRAHVTARLGRAAAPRALRLAETLPLLPSGKIDRAALAASPPDTEEEEEW
jgi:O-succinylbenzoic acid--CoA ligase